MRILHLIDAPAPGAPGDCGSDAALLACATLMGEVRRHRQDLCLLGAPRLEERAAALDLPTTDRVSPPLGRPEFAWRGLRRLLRDRGAPDAIHAWSLRAARAGVMAAPRVPVIVTDLMHWGSRSARLRMRRGGILAFSPPAGAPGSGPRIALPRPRVAPDPAARAAVRDALGLGALPVVALLGGRPEEADAMRLLLLLTLTHAAGIRAAWLVPAGSARLARAMRYQRASSFDSPLIAADLPLPDLLGTCDLAVWAGDRFAGGPLESPPSPAAAMIVRAGLDAGVPVVAPGGPVLEPLYPQPARGSLLGVNAAAPELTRVLMLLLESPGAIGRARSLLAPGGTGYASEFAGAVSRAWEAAGAHGAPAVRA